MGRRFLAVGLSFVLQAVAVSAPLVHAHLDDHHDDHHAPAHVHAHLGGHADHHGTSFHGFAIHEDESGDRVIGMPLFVAAHTDASIDFAVAQTSFAVAPAAGSIMRRPPEVVRSHGPPLAAAASPRAPPVLSVLI